MREGRLVRTTAALALAAAAACQHNVAPAHPLITARYPAAWPDATWPRSTPEAQGFSSDTLAAAIAWARAHDVNVHSVMIVRHGTIVLDAYFYPFAPGLRHDIASDTKAITALLVGIAIDNGALAGTQARIVPLLGDTVGSTIAPQAHEITLGDLLSMRSGFDCGFKHGELELSAMTDSPDWVRTALAMPMNSAPGTRWGYCSPNYHLLSAAITKATDRSALDYAKSSLFAPLGITDVAWPAGPAGASRGWGDLQLEPRDMAKIGLMVLAKGRWDTATVVSPAWIDSIATMRALVNERQDYGYGWWLSRTVPGLVEAVGRGGQRISVVPSKELVVVMTGGGFEPGDIGRFIGAALLADRALPPDRAAESRLRDAISDAGRAPAPTPVAPLPKVARRISGRVYRLGANALGIRTIELEFSDSARAMIRLSGGVELAQPIGLDGDYRTATDPSSGLLFAARGHWNADGTFALDLNALARINRFAMIFAFPGDSISIDVSESTQIGHATWRGVATAPTTHSP